MSHLSSNYGHIRTATQFLLVKVQNGMQSVLDPSLIKEGSPYTQLLRQLEANQEYRNLFTKISRYFDMFNPLRSGNLGQMLEWSTSSPLLNERLPLSLLDRIRPEIQETLTRIRFDYDESAPDEWLAFQNRMSLKNERQSRSVRHRITVGVDAKAVLEGDEANYQQKNPASCNAIREPCTQPGRG